jgi:hypothetical protein
VTAFDHALLRLRSVSRDLELKQYNVPDEGRGSFKDAYDYSAAAMLNLMIAHPHSMQKGRIKVTAKKTSPSVVSILQVATYPFKRTQFNYIRVSGTYLCIQLLAQISLANFYQELILHNLTSILNTILLVS